MQTSTTSTTSAHRAAVAASTGAPALRELSICELMAVSGGLPKGTWAAAATPAEGPIEMCLPKGTW